jgi:fumarate hydratase subunit beta
MENPQMPIEITSPINPACIEQLHSGDPVLISGILYVARDAAHKRIIETMESGKQLPFKIAGQTIYYMGPSPARSGHCIGSAGPTTSGRMDAYTLRLLEAGLCVMIGKGPRSHEVKTAIQRCRAVYCAAPGGAGALLSKCIRRNDVIAYPELGAEALRRIEVELFPAIVINDMYGGDLYESGRALFAQEPYCTNDTTR